MIKKLYKWIEWAYIFDSNIKWKTITIFSWIHWDEVSWINSTLKIIKQIEEWKIKLLSWKLKIVPKCNKEAVNKNQREVKYNLNRLFHKFDKWKTYEEKRSNELMLILEKTDFLLDLHSTSEESIPFIFAENHSLNIAKKLWFSHIVTWWDKLWFGISYDTQVYVDKHWWKGFTFEAWSHNHIDASDNAYQMILNFLSNFWLIDKNYFKKIWTSKVFEIEDVYINKSWNFKYLLNNLENFSIVWKDICIWIDWTEKIINNSEKILFMPKSESIIKRWEEVFFYVNKKK